MKDTEEAPNANEEASSRLRKILSNPTVQIAGAISSVLGFLIGVLGVYLYLQSIHKRDLTYFIYPVRTIVIKAGEVSGLTVLLRDQQIKSDVTAAQIAFWNAGKESIRADNVLRPFIIQTEDKTPILEARVREVKRDVIGIELEKSRLAEGILVIHWAILEKGDGGVVQLTISGGSEVGILATGVIEGQSKLSEYGTNTYSKILSAGLLDSFPATVLLIVFFSLGLAVPPREIAALLRRLAEGQQLRAWVRISLTAMIWIPPIIGLLVAAYFIGKGLIAQSSKPPFQF